MIRLLLVDDSPSQRCYLRALLEHDGGFNIIGEAHNGEQAVSLTERLRPDIILMDCYMPRMDGLEATREIMERCPTPIVLASANLAPRETEITFDAMRSGALAVVAKPSAPGVPDHDKMTKELLRSLRLMSEVKVVGRRIRKMTRSEPKLVPAAELNAVDIVAIGGSTGAPGVIADILGQINPVLLSPILIVQHLTEGFANRFADWLESKTTLKVGIAEHAMLAEAGRVYLAPDGKQMGISKGGRIQLSDAPAEEGFRPSVSYLFRSVATSYGRRSLGILLTGMGGDGARGLLAIRQAGGQTIAQSEDTCVVYGMPRVAVELGAAKEILPPNMIARTINALERVPNGDGSQQRNPTSVV